MAFLQASQNCIALHNFYHYIIKNIYSDLMFKFYQFNVHTHMQTFNIQKSSKYFVFPGSHQNSENIIVRIKILGVEFSFYSRIWRNPIPEDSRH